MTRACESIAITTLADTHERVIGGASRNMRTGVARGADTRRSRLGRPSCSCDGCATLGVVNAGGTSSERAGVASATSASATRAQRMAEPREGQIAGGGICVTYTKSIIDAQFYHSLANADLMSQNGAYHLMQLDRWHLTFTCTRTPLSSGPPRPHPAHSLSVARYQVARPLVSNNEDSL